MENRLFRSRTDNMIGGVCGGLGRYVGIDSSIVRLIFVLFTLAGGAGVLIYLILWLILPMEGTTTSAALNEAEFRDRAGQMRDEFIDFTRRPNPNLIKYSGIALIAVGFLLLLQALNVPWLWWLDEDLLWPLLLVLVGGVLLWRALGGKKE